MKRLIGSASIAVALATNLLMAGGDMHQAAEPVEPAVHVPKKDVVVVDDVKYDGFYAGLAYSYMRMNEALLATGYAATLSAGYYFNKYFGIEARYTRTISDTTFDSGATNLKRSDVMSNIGIYVKPIFNVTTGLGVYGLAGYGKSTYEKAGVKYSENGLQWGLGAKYELANNYGFYIDYLNLYDKDNYDAIGAQDLLYDSFTFGATYTFH